MEKLLTSWKEIAQYLNKGVRTVQRWEQQYELPVRRPANNGEGIVFAVPQELDDWLLKQQTRNGHTNGESSKLQQTIAELQAENAELQAEIAELKLQLKKARSAAPRRRFEREVSAVLRNAGRS